MPRLALIGDHDPHKTAHVVIPRALTLAARDIAAPVEWQWIGTAQVDEPAQTLAGFDGVWVVPGSPYARMDGALAAIRHARTGNLPLLGTCGGFQHALIEFARHVAGITAADHAETASRTCNLIGYKGAMPELVISELSCSLVGQTGDVVFTPRSRLHGIFSGRVAREDYHCNYGVNPTYRARLEAAGLRFTGFDARGEIRACELPAHRFFVGTLFQPERSALRDQVHPLVRDFVAAAAGGG